MSSAPTYHDHHVLVGEEPVHSVLQATVQRVDISRCQNGLRDLWILTNVFP